MSEELIERTIANLRRNGFKASFFPAREEVRKEILQIVRPGMTVGVPGSQTVRSLEVLEELEKKGCVIYDHWRPGLSSQQILEMRKKQLMADLLLVGANAITAEGEIVSVDGVGNRVASMIFGPGTKIVVVGRNKIVENRDRALERIRKVAAPQRAKDLGFDLPCTRAEGCINCDDPQRICRILVVLERCPVGSDMRVFIIDEELGY